MQDEVRELLKSNLVPDECIKLFERDGCVNLKLLAKWAPDRITMQTLVLDKCQSCKDSTQALAGLLTSVDEATAMVVEVNKRSAAGLDPEMADEPLIHSVQQALEKKFSAKYCWQLEPKYQPSNAMLGRIKREFDKNSPTIFNVLRS